MEPLGNIPSPREGHVAKIIGGDKMLVHGGVDWSENLFDDTYILAGINKSLNASYNNTSYSNVSLDNLKA